MENRSPMNIMLLDASNRKLKQNGHETWKESKNPYIKH